MKNKSLLLMIIPVCFVLFSIQLKKSDGPNYNYGLSDPSYVYLINSLSLAQMKEVGHVDHPGSPVQITGAIVVRIFHFFTHEKNDIVEDVIYRPEEYLKAIDYTFIFLNSLGLYIMGMIIFSVRKNIIISLFFQTIPFVSINLSEIFSLINPEDFAFFQILIFISVMVKFAYEKDISPKIIFYYIIGTGILCGLILASKISFICLLIIPLILFKEMRRKIIFLLTTFFSFIIFALPILSKLNYFIGWVENLVFHSGRYGKGDASILNTESFFGNVTKIFYNERFFAVVYLLILVTLILMIISGKDKINNDEKNSNESKFLWAVFCAMSLQLVLVSKHYSQRYMYPALILIIPGLYFSTQILYKRYISKFKVNTVFGIVFTLTVIFCAYNSRKIISRSKMRSTESAKLLNYVNENYQGSDVILSSGSTNEYTGLLLAYFYSDESVRNDYKSLIDKRFPGRLWYDILNDDFVYFSESSNPEKIFQSGKPVLYQTTDEIYNINLLEHLKKNFHIDKASLSKVFSNSNGESLYELVF